MSYKCPKCQGNSTDPDYCSECGALIGTTTLKTDAPVAPQATVDAPQVTAGATNASGEVCPDCLTPRTGGSRFCEVCRYDFQTKSSGAGATASDVADAPVVDAPVQTGGAPSQPVPAQAPEFISRAVSAKIDVVVIVDPSLAAEPDTLAACPKDTPERVFPLDLDENLVGRRSDGKGIFPEIEINDPGVSRRHLKFIKQQGGFAVLELGSANGTLLNGSPLESGVSTPVKAGDEFVIGMWTRLQLRTRT